MRFDLVDLQLFVAVAETRSITNGAQRVHLALASASERIKGLEDALGIVLLTRGRRGVELTPAGESLLDHARVVLHNVEAMRGDLAAFASGAKATVRFLANTSGLSEYLPKTLAAFLADHPNISIDVEERESAEIARAIVIGSADLGLAAEHALADNIERMPFSEDRLVLVAAALWAMRVNRRWLVNVAAAFGAIHFYTQWFEKLGATPVSVLLGGIVMLAVALALWSFNKRAQAIA